MTYMLNRLTHCTDVSPAEWIGRRLSDWGSGVTSVVPSGFAAYGRIVHRPSAHLPDSTAVPGRITWTEVAASTGRVAHPLMQWHAIAAGRDGRPSWDGEQPDEGELDEPQLRALGALLVEFTDTPAEAFHALWNGFGGWSSGGTVMWATGGEMPAVYRDGPELARLPASSQLEPVLPPEVLGGPLVDLPNREYFLFSGPVVAADDLRATSEFGQPDRQTPQLWWPMDRAWCVATEIDVDSTLVGGTHQLVDAILAHDDLEAFPVPPDGDLTYRGDVINDPDGTLSPF
jgi:hypothetical protein